MARCWRWWRDRTSSPSPTRRRFRRGSARFWINRSRRKPPLEKIGDRGCGRIGGFLHRQVTDAGQDHDRSEEHTSELQSLMRISYAVFCLKKKKHNIRNEHKNTNAKREN